VLVVDDDPIARRVLAAVVRAAGEFRGALAIVDDAAALDAVTELHQALRVADWATVASRPDPVHTAVLEVSASLAEPEP
jgi:CheY-like chemotaxis protein